jgi:hypothetical protein
MLKGYIDGIASSGYIEGWAFEEDTPLEPLTIAVLDAKNHEVAWGLAHRHREDLSTAGLAAGWCAFRIRTLASVSRLRNQELTLIERASRTRICCRSFIPYVEDWDAAFSAISEVVADDPTTIRSISQLNGCDLIFAQFLKRHGINAFVRAAYVYVLGRPADASGLVTYGAMIRKNVLSPFHLLVTLSDSEEFVSRARLLSAPNTSAFPFH